MITKDTPVGTRVQWEWGWPGPDTDEGELAAVNDDGTCEIMVHTHYFGRHGTIVTVENVHVHPFRNQTRPYATCEVRSGGNTTLFVPEERSFLPDKADINQPEKTK